MKALLYFLTFLFVGATTINGMAQSDSLPPSEANDNWDIGLGLGVDLGQLLQINPRVGAGQNRLGLGGALTLKANYKKGMLAWDNLIIGQLQVQKLGSGKLLSGQSIPFQKTIDELRLNSKVGRQFKGNGSKFSFAANTSVLTQLTPSFPGSSEYPGPLLSNPYDTTTQATFLSPMTMTLSLGIDFKPDSKLALFYSPIAYKGILVSDGAIAALNVHGNRAGKKSFHNFGSLIRITYSDTWWADRLSITSNLLLYSNYLMEPQNIDVDWSSEFGLQIANGLSLSLIANVFYDHDVLVQISDVNAPGGTSGLGRRVSLTQQLLFKYSRQF